MALSRTLASGPGSAGGRPLHDAVAERLAEFVRSEGIGPDGRLPAERRLSDLFAVSRVTVRQALTALEDQGVVYRSPSRGWFVSGQQRPRPSSATGHRVEGFADYARTHGLKAHARVLTSQVRACTVQEAELLHMAPGAPVFELRRLRYLDDLVIALEHNRLVLGLCPNLPEIDFGTASLYATLRAADPPQVPAAAEYSVEARAPSAEEMTLLETDASVPMLVATQLTYNQRGRPIELTVQSYRGDRYRFQATITDGS